MEEVKSTDERELRRRLAALARTLSAASITAQKCKDASQELETKINSLKYDHQRIVTLVSKVLAETK
jgi:hypothetical protein